MSKFFGKTIRQTAKAFAPDKGHGGTTTARKDDFISKAEAIARIVITILLFGLAVYLLENDTQDNPYTEFATTIVGGIIGYWLR